MDCEYNRNHLNHGASKRIHVVEDKLREIVHSTSSVEIISDTAYRELSVYPDIIVHKRGKQNKAPVFNAGKGLKEKVQ